MPEFFGFDRPFGATSIAFGSGRIFSLRLVSSSSQKARAMPARIIGLSSACSASRIRSRCSLNAFWYAVE